MIEKAIADLAEMRDLTAQTGIKLAKQSIISGKALEKLNALKIETNKC